MLPGDFWSINPLAAAMLWLLVIGLGAGLVGWWVTARAARKMAR